MVFTYHTWQFSGSPSIELALGGRRLDLLGFLPQFPSGVDIFIVLSGLSLFLPYANPEKRWNLRNYTIRRVFRILPPYYVAIAYLTLLPVALVIVYKLAGMPARWQPFPSAFNYLTHVTFTHTFFATTWDGIEGAFWTIGLEAQLYVIFPLAVLAYRRWGTRAIWMGIAASIAYRVAIQPLATRWGYPKGFLLTVLAPGRWMEFGTGMLVAWLIVRLRREGAALRWFRRVPEWGWVPLGLIFYVLAVSEPVLRFAAFPAREILLSLAAAAVAIGACLTPTRLAAPLRSRALVSLGLVSYSFYLVHQNTAWYLDEFYRKTLGIGPMPRLALQWTVTLGVIVLIARVFYRFAERPSTSAGRRLTAERVDAGLGAAEGTPGGPIVVAGTATGTHRRRRVSRAAARTTGLEVAEFQDLPPGSGQDHP